MYIIVISYARHIKGHKRIPSLMFTTLKDVLTFETCCLESKL